MSASKPENYETLRGISRYAKEKPKWIKNDDSTLEKDCSSSSSEMAICISGFYSIYNFSKDLINHHLGDQEKGGRHSVLLKKPGCCSRLKMKMGICCPGL